MVEPEEEEPFVRYRSFCEETGKPYLTILAHPSTPEEVLIEMLEIAIESIKKHINQTPVKPFYTEAANPEEGGPSSCWN